MKEKNKSIEKKAKAHFIYLKERKKYITKPRALFDNSHT